jgi:hypothetical protein
MRNKSPLLCVFFILIITLLMGCSEEKVANKEEEETKSVATTSNKVKEENEKTPIDVSSLVGQQFDDVKQIIGEPNEQYEGEEITAIYDGLEIYIDSYSNKIISLSVKSTDYTVAGVKLGLMPGDVRGLLGKSAIEKNGDEAWYMEYSLQDGQVDAQFYATNFRSPIDYISLSLASYIQAGQIDVIVDEAKQLILGNWILDELTNTEYIEDAVTTIDENSFTTGGAFSMSETYQIVDENIIQFQTYNSISDEHSWVDMRYVFLDEGNTLMLYREDPLHENQMLEDSIKTYYRYSN